MFYFDKAVDRFPVVAPPLDAGGRAELRQRTRESVVRIPSSPRRARAGPAGPPKEDPRETQVATGEASLQVTVPGTRSRLLLPGSARSLRGCRPGTEMLRPRSRTARRRVKPPRISQSPVQ